MITVACIIIAGGRRSQLIDDFVLPSALQQHEAQFDRIIVVGEHHPGDGYTYLNVPALTKSTVDALIKRDVGALASGCDILVYLSDDHRLAHPDFLDTLKKLADLTNLDQEWDAIVPARYVQHPTQGLIPIPNGQAESYCAGHGGIFKQALVKRYPWSTYPHDRLWDILGSHILMNKGVKFCHIPDFAIEDLEPERRPWE